MVKDDDAALAPLVLLRVGLARYFRFYNREGPHQAVDWRTSGEVYFGMQEAAGDPEVAAAAVTPVGLRPPSVTATDQDRFHLKSDQDWS